MSKSILIINTPENCSHCHQCYRQMGSKNKYIYFCGNKVFHEGKDAMQYSVDPEGTKPYWCPLITIKEDTMPAIEEFYPEKILYVQDMEEYLKKLKGANQ